MTKSLAAAGAVSSQLHHEGRWPPNDLNKVMGSDYHYNNDTLGLFLSAVSWNLRNGTPRYYFHFDAAFVQASLGATVGALMGAVDHNTSISDLEQVVDKVDA